MKIKRKVKKNLPQLIEWGFKQEVLPPMFHGSRNGSVVQFTPGGWVNINGIEPTDTFTVEGEEEITEDTFFKHLIKVTEDGEHYSTDFFKVRDLIHLGTEEVHAYIDGEYKLIWTREKGLVE